MKKIYRVGIYCRLSTDDANNSSKAKNYIPSDESVSIENQKELLSKFVMLNGWIETKTYVDDGYSGGNFQRPGFLEMLEDARHGIINLILVKDLSRLGRDFVEVGRYTDVVFPSLGCRFVSVLDCLDSDGDNTDMLHFRSLMNDYHLRDLSMKIKSVLHSKKQNGEFLSSYAPYGYKKSEADKHKLVIDEYAAGVVRSIFDMRYSGMSYTKIAASLNQSEVLPPRFYWNQNAGHDCTGVTTLWTARTIKLILQNEVYIGTLVLNQGGHRSYKDKTKIMKPESEWIRIENAHEPIISLDVWNEVQKRNHAAKLRAVDNHAPSEKLFTGKLICADCKGRMNSSTKHVYASSEKKRGRYLTDKNYVTYFCGKYNRSGHAFCSCHLVSEITLSKILIAEIKSQAQAVTTDEAAVVERLKSAKAEYDAQQLSDTRQEISLLRRRVAELDDRTAKLYEDKISGVINADTFTMLVTKNEQERSEKAGRLEKLLAEVEKVEQSFAAIQNWTALVRKYLDLQVLDRKTIDELIDHIEIGEHVVVDGKRTQDIKVFYRFVGHIQ